MFVLCDFFANIILYDSYIMIRFLITQKCECFSVSRIHPSVCYILYCIVRWSINHSFHTTNFLYFVSITSVIRLHREILFDMTQGESFYEAVLIGFLVGCTKFGFTEFGPLNYLFKGWALYHFQAWGYRNLRAFEFFNNLPNCILNQLEVPKLSFFHVRYINRRNLKSCGIRAFSVIEQIYF